MYICTPFGIRTITSGEMAEWSNAAVLKTVDLNGSGGSNPSLSATQKKKSICPSLLEQVDFFFCVVRMPSADFRDYVEIPLFNLSVQVYLSKQISFFCCKDAVGRL